MCAGEDMSTECGCGGRHGQPGHHSRGGCGLDAIANRFFRPYVLLLLAEEPAHGYELMKRLSGFGVIQNSTEPSFLYRVLRMMEAEGLLASKLDPTGSGPARKVYELTGEGQEVLSMWVAKLEEMCAFFTSFGRRYAALSRAEGRSQ